MSAIEVNDLEKRYGDTLAVGGVSFEVDEGEVFALLGQNGAGKTTTVRILATLIRPDGGRARVAGHDVVRERGDVRRRISLTGQYVALDELLTGEENLRLIARLRRMSTREARARTAELLSRFALEEAADRRVVGGRVRLAQADARGDEDFLEIRKNIDEALRPDGLVVGVGVGEGIKRQLPRGALEQLGHAGHLADENRVPSLDELLVGHVKVTSGFEPGEIFHHVDLAHLMAMMGHVAAEALFDQARIAAGVTGPARNRAFEIDVDHDAAEIEQQGVGGTNGHFKVLAGR